VGKQVQEGHVWKFSWGSAPWREIQTKTSIQYKVWMGDGSIWLIYLLRLYAELKTRRSYQQGWVPYRHLELGVCDPGVQNTAVRGILGSLCSIPLHFASSRPDRCML
jgi:hypothetical protein